MPYVPGFLQTVYLPGYGSDNHGQENLEEVNKLFPPRPSTGKGATKGATKGAATGDSSKATASQ
jgi:hypothetical protein